jgi:hypothetical protein
MRNVLFLNRCLPDLLQEADGHAMVGPCRPPPTVTCASWPMTVRIVCCAPAIWTLPPSRVGVAVEAVGVVVVVAAVHGAVADGPDGSVVRPAQLHDSGRSARSHAACHVPPGGCLSRAAEFFVIGPDMVPVSTGWLVVSSMSCPARARDVPAFLLTPRALCLLGLCLCGSDVGARRVVIWGLPVAHGHDL